MFQNKTISIPKQKMSLSLKEPLSLDQFLKIDMENFTSRTFREIPWGYESQDVNNPNIDPQKEKYIQHDKIYSTEFEIPDTHDKCLASQIPYSENTQKEFLNMISKKKQPLIIVNLRKKHKWIGYSQYIKNSEVEVYASQTDMKAPIDYYRLKIHGKPAFMIHYHWPKEGTPDIKKFKRLIKQVYLEAAGTQSPYLVVHCKQGIDRTGIFLLTYSLYAGIKKKLESGLSPQEIKVDPVGLLKYLRRKRPRMILGEKQYAFALQATQELIAKLVTKMKRSEKNFEKFF